ncbi:hypothetical protein HMPREF9144_1220 [Prevotella pallens ATCC 700821]|uniref:Uncharacterized protein n=1 Tax=Prevotella pallens ATCC 700821 TaxID=997353 RepID=F9DHT0_9BACT|nr:hypothetical protein HMPREF9144_1220 [Prevotella pallens ATCC 700821]
MDTKQIRKIKGGTYINSPKTDTYNVNRFLLIFERKSLQN